jgi:hypothetical protein
MTKPTRDALRERLLAQQSMPSERLERYRLEVEEMLEQKEKGVVRERKVTRGVWVYVVILSTAFIVIGGLKNDTLVGLWFGILACFWLLLGSVFLLRQLMNQHTLETLKELKGLEVQILELRRRIDEREQGAGGPK